MGRNFQIYILEQVDGKPFNRGALMNVGILKAKEEGAKFIAVHDVDRVIVVCFKLFTF